MSVPMMAHRDDELPDWVLRKFDQGFGVRELPGSLYVVEPNAELVEQLMDGGDDKMAQLLRTAAACTFDASGRQIWESEQAALAAPWRRVKLCADTALALAGLSDEDPAGN